MSTPNSEKKIILKDGTYFKVDVTDQCTHEDLVVYTPEPERRILLVWHADDLDTVTATCWEDDFDREELIP